MVDFSLEALLDCRFNAFLKAFLELSKFTLEAKFNFTTKTETLSMVFKVVTAKLQSDCAASCAFPLLFNMLYLRKVITSKLFITSNSPSHAMTMKSSEEANKGRE